MSMVLIDLDTWFPFIRSLRALQSASFQLSLQDDDFENYARPSVGILPRLTMLHISASQHWNDTGEYPLKAIFDNLQLPALRTLSLESRLGSWYDPTAFTEVHAALQSAPAITKLSVGISFLEREAPPADTGSVEQTPVEINITPLAEGAPRLEHLSFAMKDPLRRSSVVELVDGVFASGRWLDLKSPASTIREVTFVASDTSLATHVHLRWLVSEVRKFAKDNVIVEFEEEGPVEVRRAIWGW
ncbi:hypothetical protein BJ912DRAFT_1060009 [Pholiota molesta]|nr:hypothetical protein BJ912DRAFT_1060009 [Pholiota molesta]